MATDPRSLPGLRLLIDANDQFRKADGMPCAPGDACVLAGAGNTVPFDQADATKRPTYQEDAAAGHLLVASGQWMQADTLARWFSGTAGGCTVVAVYDTTNVAAARYIFGLGSSTGNARFRLRADGTAVRGEAVADTGSTRNLGGPSSVPPRAAEPNCASAAIGRDGYGWGRKDGGFSSTFNVNAARDGMDGVSLLVSDLPAPSTFQSVTLGGQRTGGSLALSGVFIGKIYRIAVFDRRLSREEVRGVEEWLVASMDEPGAVRFSGEEGRRYVASSGGDDVTNLGLLPTEPLATCTKAHVFGDGGDQRLLVRATEAAPHREEFKANRIFTTYVQPWPGYEHGPWHASILKDASTVWTLVAGSVYSLSLPGLSSPGVCFTDLPGPLGAPQWALRKVAGVSWEGTILAGATETTGTVNNPYTSTSPAYPLEAGYFLQATVDVLGVPTLQSRQIVAIDLVTGAYTLGMSADGLQGPGFSSPPVAGTSARAVVQAPQKAPPVGQFGWDTDARTVYVNVGLDPNGHPCEIGQGYAIDCWRGKAIVKDLVFRYGAAGNLMCGDGFVGEQSAIQGEAEWHDCLSEYSGVNTAGNFGVRGNGMLARGYRCVSRFGPNDGISAHCQRSNTEGGVLEMYDFVSYGNQDEGASGHEGSILRLRRGHLWNNGSGNMTSVAALEDARPTTVEVEDVQYWDDGKISTAYQGLSWINPRMRGCAKNCLGDKPVTVVQGVPESYVVRYPEFDPIPTEDFSPPEAPEWAPYP